MMNDKSWPYLNLILCLFVLLFFLGGRLFAPTVITEGIHGDALKNYYTLVYYVQNDAGLHFSGMNYPHGEHITYTDNIPVLALSLQFIHKHIVSLSAQNILQIVNFTLLLGLLLYNFFVYLILRAYKVAPYFAAFAAICISLLNPQLIRINGHFALGYSFFFPICWYAVIRILAWKAPLKWAFTIIVSLFIAGLCHLYLCLIFSAFLLAFSTIFTIKEQLAGSKYWPKSLLLFACSLLPLSLLLIFMAFSDTTLDRPKVPYGFYQYDANIGGILFPNAGPVYDFIMTQTKRASRSGEGAAYIGFLGLIVLLGMLLVFIKNLRQKAYRQLATMSPHPHLGTALGAALLLLIFATGDTTFPFLGYLYDPILALDTPLNQFRSIGRFSWIFYLCFNVYIAWFLFHKLPKGRNIKMLVLSLIFGIWGFDAWNNIRETNKRAPFQEQQAIPLDYSNILKEKGLSPSDFQAILGLPYFMIGSEKITVNESAGIFNHIVELSLQTELPLINIMLSRTSLAQASSNMQLFADPEIEKEWLKGLTSTKPILTLVSAAQLDQNSQRFIDQSQLLYSGPKIRLYQSPLSAFMDSQEAIVKKFKQQKDNLYHFPNYYLSDSTDAIFIKDFNSKNADLSSLEEQAAAVVNFSQHYSSQLPIYKGPLLMLPKGSKAELSIWLYIDNKRFGSGTIHIKQYNSKGDLLEDAQINGNANVNLYRGHWQRMSLIFTPHLEVADYEIYIDGKSLRADNLLIRPVGVDFYQQKDSVLVFNNYLIPCKTPQKAKE
jgi:hypothetical protein